MGERGRVLGGEVCVRTSCFDLEWSCGCGILTLLHDGFWDGIFLEVMAHVIKILLHLRLVFCFCYHFFNFGRFSQYVGLLG